tara:strand:+ start:10375 stop:11775 length:1401 start_codon:yes stop_codon:yes gene_type:complete
MDKQLKERQLSVCPVAWQAHLTPNLIAIQTDSQRISFVELHHRVTSIGQQLIKLSIKPKDRVACIATNSLPLIFLQLACLRHGFIFCPINAKFKENEIEQRLSVLKTSFVWHQEQTQNKLTLDFQKSLPETLLKQPINVDSFAIEKLNVVSIIFTSGSSGLPKAVMHHFSNHYYSALGSQTVIPLTTEDKNLLSLPIYHISGYATVMRTLLAGATLQFFDQKMSTKLLLEIKTTHLSLVCSQLIQLLEDPNFNADSLTIKHLLLGGSTFPSKTLQQTQVRGFTYHLSYGSTEMASQIATSTNNELLTLLPYREIKIVDKEILLAGKTRFVGYFQHKQIESDQYFASSDLGKMSGKIIKIIGRKDRQFISGGENIQPEEIEKTLLTFAGLSQAYVLPINDVRYGQRPVAFIKWTEEDQSTQLDAFIKNKLITFKQPIHYFTLPSQEGIKPNQQKLTEIANKRLKGKR